MKNADMPAMPQSGTVDSSGDWASSKEWGGVGLTKREHFAAMAMQGLISTPDIFADCSDSDIAKWSIEQADALLKALDESEVQSNAKT